MSVTDEKKKWYRSYPPKQRYLKKMEKIKTSLEIEKNIHTKFKSKCALEGKSMRDVMLESIKEYIEDSSEHSSKK